jgi:hypothetical protein
VQNINGLTGGGGEAGVTWTRPEVPEDSTGVAADTTGIGPDTLGIVPDSIPPDTSRVLFRGVLPAGGRKKLP